MRNLLTSLFLALSLVASAQTVTPEPEPLGFKMFMVGISLYFVALSILAFIVAAVYVRVRYGKWDAECVGETLGDAVIAAAVFSLTAAVLFITISTWSIDFILNLLH